MCRTAPWRPPRASSPAGRVQGDEHFVHREVYIGGQIRHAYRRQVVGKALHCAQRSSTGTGLGMLGIIGHDGYILLGGKITQLGHQLRVQQFLVEDLSAAAVQDRAAIVERMHPPVLSNSSSLASGATPPVGRPEASTRVTPWAAAACRAARVRGDHLVFVVGQRAVQFGASALIVMLP